MSIDLTKLTPLPLSVGCNDHGDGPMVMDATGFPILLSETDNVNDLKFFALARNAFDVMTRRGLGLAPLEEGQWAVRTREGFWFENASKTGESNKSICWFADPFTALVSADKWMTEREKESKP